MSRDDSIFRTSPGERPRFHPRRTLTPRRTDRGLSRPSLQCVILAPAIIILRELVTVFWLFRGWLGDLVPRGNIGVEILGWPQGRHLREFGKWSLAPRSTIDEPALLDLHRVGSAPASRASEFRRTERRSRPMRAQAGRYYGLPLCTVSRALLNFLGADDLVATGEVALDQDLGLTAVVSRPSIRVLWHPYDTEIAVLVDVAGSLPCRYPAALSVRSERIPKSWA